MVDANTPSLEADKKYIYSIDFSRQIEKMVFHQGWLKKDALVLCDMYRNFLFLQKKYRGQYQLPPSEDIDEFWHLHILDTQNYRRDCDAIFGEYLDHYPYFGIDEQSNFEDLESAFETMQALYAKEFDGQQIVQVRNWVSKLVWVLKSCFVRRPKKIRARDLRQVEQPTSTN